MAGAISATNELVEICKRHALPNVSMMELTEEFEKLKSRLLTIASQKLGLSTNLHAIEVESDKKLKELSAARDARDRVEDSPSSVVGQSLEALLGFII